MNKEEPGSMVLVNFLLHLLVLAAISLELGEAFQSSSRIGPGAQSLFAIKRFPFQYTQQSSCRIFSVGETQQTDVPPIENEKSPPMESTEDPNTSGANDEATLLKAEADRIRMEAEQMDSALTRQKVENLERKLSNNSWLAKNPDEVEASKLQLDKLNRKLSGNGAVSSWELQKTNTNNLQKRPEDNTPRKMPSDSKAAKDDKNRLEENPLSGYDEADLELYIPVVNEIEKRMPNATLDEKLEAFRAAPELQDHFQDKIRQMLVQPIEDMQRLENLKQDYLASSSSLEKKQIKREMEQLEKSVEDESPFIYSDSIVYTDLPPLTEEEMQKRLEAVGQLSPILQALYKKRCGINETADIRLAIELDHYEPQIQLLEQVKFVQPVTDEMRHEIRIGFLSLPSSVRDHFARNLGLDDGEDVCAVVEALATAEGDEWMTLQQVIQAAGDNGKDDNDDSIMTTADLPEYADIDFIDRSRYIQEFIPALARLEMIHPSIEDIETLMKEVLDRRLYTVTSKPERVIGGYYIRGQNQLATTENPNTDSLVSMLQDRLQKSSLRDKIDLFYIQDPTPPTDEEYEVGAIDRPILVVTAKNRELLYNPSASLTKALVTCLGLFSVLLFSIATAEMQPTLREQLDAAAAGDLTMDISRILDGAFVVAVSILTIQIAHEAAHRFVAWRDKFEIGLPNLIPAIQIGLQGAITPFKSPPPNLRSLFDFSIAGPLAGLMVSICLLVGGLNLTPSLDISESNQFPALPVFLLKSSALGGGLVEYFIGKGALTSSSSESVLPLHPFAIAGFVGMFSNALALLPIGHTDGGKIATTMFGRRGAYLVNTFTTLILSAVGIFGFDEQRLFLTYVLFSMIWQRELEAPTLNEADDLDFSRGLVGIASAIIVFLALMPML